MLKLLILGLILGLAPLAHAEIEYESGGTGGGGGTTTNNTSFVSSTRTICLCGFGSVAVGSVGFSPSSIDWINDAYSTWTISGVQAVVTYPTSVGDMIFNANFSTRALTGVGAFRAIDATSWTITTGNTESGEPTVPSVKTQIFPREKLSLTVPTAPTTGVPAGGIYGLLITAERTGP